jgi:hypothetical protein
MATVDTRPDGGIGFAVKGLRMAAVYFLVSLGFSFGAAMTNSAWQLVLAVLAALFLLVALWCGVWYVVLYRFLKRWG